MVVAAAVKVVEEADAPAVVGADKVVEEWEAAAVAVVVRPVVAGAAGIANSSRPTGRQKNWRPVFVFSDELSASPDVVNRYLRTRLLTPRTRSVAVDS